MKMAGDITTEAVRLALGMREAQARIAGTNIANASKPDARAMRADFSRVEAALRGAVHAGGVGEIEQLDMTAAQLQGIAQPGADPIVADEEVGDMVTASTHYQSLTEALSRHFGLMRLALTGRT
jgi:flagellar basal-body rod protein FlgB